jgi:hypothetical protein
MSGRWARATTIRRSWPVIVVLMGLGYTTCFIVGFALDHGSAHVYLGCLVMLLSMIAAFVLHDRKKLDIGPDLGEERDA